MRNKGIWNRGSKKLKRKRKAIWMRWEEQQRENGSLLDVRFTFLTRSFEKIKSGFKLIFIFQKWLLDTLDRYIWKRLRKKEGKKRLKYESDQWHYVGKYQSKMKWSNFKRENNLGKGKVKRINVVDNYSFVILDSFKSLVAE